MVREHCHLDRAVILHLWPSGKIVARDKADKRKETKKAIQGSLPVFSVDSMEDANGLLAMMCKLSREDNETYFLPFTGEVDDMAKVSAMMEEVYTIRRAGGGKEAWAPFNRYREAAGLL